MSLTTLHQPQILIIEALLLKAINNDLDRYQISLCHMNAKSKPKERVQYRIVAEVASFVVSEGEYVNGDRKATSTRPDTRHKSFAVFVSARRQSGYGRTDGPTDGPTDGRTHPLIESWLTTKNDVEI